MYEIVAAGGAECTRCLIRPSTGTRHGYYALAFFETVQASDDFKKIKMKWASNGEEAPIRRIRSIINLILEHHAEQILVCTVRSTLDVVFVYINVNKLRCVLRFVV